MAYRRRSYRRGRRAAKRWRYGRLIRNRSSIAQAGQIKALSSRINRVYKKLKPDTNVWYTDSFTKVFDNSVISNTYYVSDLYSSVFKSQSGTNFGYSTGDTRRLYNVRFFGNFEYEDNYVVQPQIDHQRTCMARIIIAQRIQGSANKAVVGDIVNIESSGAGYELNCLKPLKDNVTDYVKILYDKAYTFSDQRPIRAFNINLRKILPWRFSSGDTYHYGSFVFIVVTAGLHWDTTYVQKLKLNYSVKLACPEP
uniref:Capsid protein n=1 Tax=Cygnus atratus CRESS-DNA-virus sp. TaxID=2815026 RepID=A0A8A4XB53_9VIRU|nr:MAG: capsid protein [Cygnus atratus CRESS-DNA-virus sp.]